VKVVHICQFLGVGGLEKVLYLLIKEQLKAGHHVELIVYDYEQAWVSKFKDLNIHVHNQKIKSNGYDYTLIPYINDIIKNFDIIHTHDLNPVLYVGPLKILTKLVFKKFPKFIHTTHGMEHIQLAPKTRLYERFLSLVVDRIVAVSPAFKDYYLNKTFANSKKVFNIDNGSDIENDFPVLDKASFKEQVCNAHDIPTDQELWIILARIFPLKDQKIVSDIMSNFPEATLLICGPCPDKLYLEQIKMSQPKNVVLTGPIEDVDLYLKASSLFISASHHEGIPISVLEAAANGVPCVLSNIEGHRTLYKNENFFVFEPKQSQSLIDCLNSITEENKLQKAKKLHKTVYDLYSSHRMFKDYEEVYLS
jgi:glycosyltransferase involved in cell wall biosynthesis